MAVVSPWLFLLLSFCCLFACSLWFFSSLLFKDYEVKKLSVQLFFSATFTFSAALLEFILLEILQAFDYETRKIFWQFDIVLLVVLLIVVLPFAFFYAICREQGSSRWLAYIGAVCAVGAFWWLSARAARLTDIDAVTTEVVKDESAPSSGVVSESHAIARILSFVLPPHSFELPSWLQFELHVRRAGVVGIVFAAILSGFGAANCAYTVLFAFRSPLSSPVATSSRLASSAGDSFDRLQARERLLQTLQLISSKKKRLLQLQRMQSDRRLRNRKTVAGVGSSVLSRAAQYAVGVLLPWRWGSTPWSQPDSGNVVMLASEIRALELLASELFLAISELDQDLKQTRFFKSRLGRWYLFAQNLLAGYCVYKMIMTALNLLLNRVNKQDPISRLIQLTLSLLAVSLDYYPFWAQNVSFIFVLFLAVSNIRGFGQQLLRVFHRISSSVSSNSMVLVLAEVMGLYFISTILLLKMNLPPQYRDILTDVFGNIDFTFLHRLFDKVFLISSAVSAVILYMNHSVSRGKLYHD